MQSLSSSDSTYTGGVFRFIPFNESTWVSTFVQDGFMQIQIQIMLSILLILILIQCFLMLRYILCSSSRFNRSAEHNQSDQSRKQFITSSQETSTAESTASCSSFDRDESTNRWRFVTAELQNQFSQRPGKSNDVNNSLEMFPQVFTADTEQEATNVLKSQYKSLVIKECTQDAFCRPISSKGSGQVETSGLHRKIITLSLVAAFFAICFITHIISLIVAMRADHRVTESLEQLPQRTDRLAIQTREFAEYGLDSAYNLTCTHIRNDAARSDGKSHLRFVVERAKILGSQAVACLVQPCTVNTTGTQAILLFPGNQSEAFFGLEQVPLPTALLTTFNLVLSSLKALSEASVALNEQMIQDTERAWYEYRQGLTGIVPLQNVGTEQSIMNMPWTSSTLLNRTRHEICSNLVRIKKFTSCAQIDTFLNSFVVYANQLPTMLPRNKLESVVQFASIPRALHAEQLVEDWLPVITDLPGQGVLFLLRNYLLPEINLLKAMLSRFVETAPQTKEAQMLIRYTRYFNSTMIIVFTLLLLCDLLLLFTTCFFIFRSCAKPNVEKNNRHARLMSSSETMSCSPKRFGHKYDSSVRHCGRFCARTTLVIIVFVICLIVAVLGCALSYTSIVTETDVCIYVFQGPAQVKADMELSHGLYKLLSNLEKLQSLLAIPYLNLAIPYPILNTLDSDYRTGQIPLLSSLHINRPCNFTALLNSNWFNQTLMRLWDKDVRAKLHELDLASKLPKISLFDVYSQVAKSMKLERSFDQLSVGELHEYLNDPGPAYVADLYEMLLAINSSESRLLGNILSNVTNAYKVYEHGYVIARQNLVKIQTNKQLIAPVNSLVANASKALDQLNLMNNSELMALIDQVITIGWPQFLPTVVEQLIPFLLRLFDELIPYAGLKSIYREALGLVCPFPVITTAPAVSTMSFVPPLNPELNRLGSGLFTSAVTLMIAGMLSLMIP